MAITAEEAFARRRLSEERAERVYIVRGTDDDAAARSAAAAVAPGSITVGLTLLQRDELEVEEVSGDIWIAYATYSKPSAATGTVAEVSSFSFDTRGGIQHITQSLATIESYPTGTPYDFDGAIGVSKENDVEGVDVTVPVFSFEVSKSRETASSTYIGSLYDLTGKTNNAGLTITTDDGASISFAAGEVLFLGAAGAKRGDEPWQFTYAFAASPNRTGLSVGTISGVAKKGWEYLWAHYRESVATSGGQQVLAVRPVAAFVEQVYEAGNYGALEL